MAEIVHLSPVHPEPDGIARAASIIRNGGVVVFPTSGLYGLAADAGNRDAVARVFEIKKRTAGKPLSILIGKTENLPRLVRRIPVAARNIMDRFWPGGITIVFEDVGRLPPNLTAGSGKIGIRLPGFPVSAALVSAFGGPITATSANLSGRPGCFRIPDLDPEILEKADLVLDAGAVTGGSGSTIVDVTTDPPVILREGAVSTADIASCIESP